jgi:Glycosyl transferase family 2
VRYTIITPTICRESLLRLCKSLDAQSYSGWEHLVVIDLPYSEMSRAQRRILRLMPQRSNRILFHCDRRHNNYGHTCRHQVWDHVQGNYILYLDDDDYFADNDVLDTLNSVTEPWAVFPILRHGKLFFHLPPGTANTGTGMFIHKKEIGRWPDKDDYEADGSFVEELRRQYPYQVVDSRPLVHQPASSCGVPNAETWLGHKLANLRLLWLTRRYEARKRSEV